jgi:hypothetical protein
VAADADIAWEVRKSFLFEVMYDGMIDKSIQHRNVRECLFDNVKSLEPESSCAYMTWGLIVAASEYRIDSDIIRVQIPAWKRVDEYGPRVFKPVRV